MIRPTANSRSRDELVYQPPSDVLDIAAAPNGTGQVAVTRQKPIFIIFTQANKVTKVPFFLYFPSFISGTHDELRKSRNSGLLN